MTGDELRNQRLALGLSQVTLAQHLDVSNRTIITWEQRGVPALRLGQVRRTLAELEVLQGQRPAGFRYDQDPTQGWRLEWITADGSRQEDASHRLRGEAEEQARAWLRADPQSRVYLYRQSGQRSVLVQVFSPEHG